MAAIEEERLSFLTKDWVLQTQAAPFMKEGPHLSTKQWQNQFRIEH
jgi:hypothetical protein